MLIQAGTADEIVPYQASVELVKRVNAVCGEGRAVLESIQARTTAIRITNPSAMRTAGSISLTAFSG